MIAYEDVLLYLPELTHMLKKYDTLIYDCQAFISYNVSERIITVAISYQYSKPAGFRSISVLGFQNNGEIIVLNKVHLHILERCMLWGYSIRNEQMRYSGRLALIKLELMEYVWNPMRSTLKVLMET